jgi:hypothetical protein
MLKTKNTPSRPVGRPKGSGAAAPAQQLNTATYATDTHALANDLAKFIKENKLSTQMQGKEFVNVEGWQYAGSRLGILPIVEHLTNCSTEQELKYEAKVTLLQLSSGLTVGAGFAICSNKESGKKFNQEFAIASMAQTRAIGKAYRNILAWILRAAGYEATPAEEMEYQSAQPAPVAQGQPAVQQPAPAAVVPNGAPARITLPMPEPIPAAAAELQPAVPAMQVSNRPKFRTAADAVAARTTHLQAQGVPMSTDLQHELIRELLECGGIDRTARNTTLLNYLRFTRERANISIAKLIEKIKGADEQLPENLLRKLAAIKEEGEQLLQDPERAAAAEELRQFVQANAASLGDQESARLLSICGNTDWPAPLLLTEKQNCVQALAQKAAA